MRGISRGDSRLGVVAFLGAAALMFVALIAFARYPSLFHRGNSYRAVFQQVTGVNLGDEVRYGGLVVGSITSLEIDPADPTRIIVSFRVRSSTPVRVDTRASISQLGLLGQPYLSLRPGRRDAPPLRPGSMLLSEENLTIQDAMSRLAAFLERADTLFGGVEKMAKTSPLERLNRTMMRVDTLIAATDVNSRRAFEQLDSVSLRLSGLLVRSERLITAMDSTVRTASPELASTQTEAMATLRDMRTLVGQLSEAIDRGERIDVIVRNMETASENLARLSERVERDPTSVLRRTGTVRKPAGPPP